MQNYQNISKNYIGQVSNKEDIKENRGSMTLCVYRIFNFTSAVGITADGADVITAEKCKQRYKIINVKFEE